MVYTFTLAEAVEQAWLAIGGEQSEAQKGLYRDEMARLEDFWMRRVGHKVAVNPEMRRLLQTEFTVPVLATLGACSLEDNAAGKSPADPWIIFTEGRDGMPECCIERVYVQLGTGEFVTAHKLAHPDDLFREGWYGRLWWAIRNRVLETINTDGTTRYTSGGSTLDGNFFITTSYIPSVATFPTISQLQQFAIEEMVAIAREKRDDRFAQAVAKQLRRAA